MLVLLIILGVYVFMDLLLITIFCVRHKVNPFTRLKQAFDMLFNKKKYYVDENDDDEYNEEEDYLS